MNSLAAPTFLENLSNKRNLVGGIILLIIASIFVYVYAFGVNVIFLDEWALVPTLKQYQAQGLSFDLLFKQHNEHRLFFPRLFYLETFQFTYMNSLFYMYFNAFMLCTEFLCMYLIAKRQFNFSFRNIPIWLIIVPLFVFNFRQSQNVIWAFQIAFYMVLTFAVMTLYFIEKIFDSTKPASKFIFLIFGLVCAVIATFSSAMGLMVWLAGGIQIFIKSLHNKKMAKWLFLAAWVVITAVAFYVYNHGLKSSIPDDVKYAISHPFNFIHFFFCLISLTSVHSLSIIALPIGIALFSASVYILFKTYKNKRLTENSFWIALYTFSLLFALINTLGRSPIAFEYTDRARYTIFTSLLSISTFMLFYDDYVNSNKQSKIFGIAFFCFLLLGLELSAVGVAYGFYQRNQELKMVNVILNYKTQPAGEEMKKMYPWVNDEFVKMVDESVPYVDSNHYNLFAEKK